MLIKKLTVISCLLLTAGSLLAQKADYKNGIISVDGKSVAKVMKIKDKENFGLTSSFELYSMNGEKLIIAVISTEFEEDRNDNSYYYYRFTFLTANKTAVFAIGKLTAEKSFARLIGESGIMVNDKMDEAKLSEFIALKSRSPRIPETAVEYVLVNRARNKAVLLRDNQVYQGDVLIGEYRDVTRRTDFDQYEFRLVNGPLVARVSFTGGNNAKDCRVVTSKDNNAHSPVIASAGTYGKLIVGSAGMDRNYITLQKIATWLVSTGYL